MHDQRGDSAGAAGEAGPPGAAGPEAGGSQGVGGFRERIRRRRTVHLVYRTVVGVLGTAIIALGIVLLPLPGPGWLVIFLGLGLLATEFAWAERLLEYARDKVLGWTHWVARQSLVVRALIGLGCLLIVVGALWLYDQVVGIPGWVPVIG